MEPRDFILHTLMAKTANFPVDNQQINEALQLAATSSMSTHTIGGIVHYLTRHLLEGTCYLNIGTYYGFTLFAGMAGNPDKICIGVDNFSEFDKPRANFNDKFKQLKSDKHFFFDEDFVEYLKKHTTPIGLYYYDGPHYYQDQFDGLELAHPHIVAGGYAMVDDTNDSPPRVATYDFLAKHANEYEVIADIVSGSSSCSRFWNGLIILRKRKSPGGDALGKKKRKVGADNDDGPRLIHL